MQQDFILWENDELDDDRQHGEETQDKHGA